MVELIGAPFDLCSPILGSRLGPMAVRLYGVVEALRDLGLEVEDRDDAFGVTAVRPRTYGERVALALEAYRALKGAVGASLGRGSLPVVVAGDHSLALASIAAALEVHGDDLGVLWVDAHMDLNTPATSPSANLHGMPLAALMRMDVGGEVREEHKAAWDAWPVICDEIVGAPGLRADRVAWIGLRDVDEGEVFNYQKAGCGNAFTMADVDKMGVNGVMSQILRWVEESGIKKLWVSFDVDSLDPLLAPGTGTKVRGGLTYREGHLVAETLHEYLSRGETAELVGVDVVEVNPLTDVAGETAKVANEWLASLFGNQIMRSR